MKLHETLFVSWDRFIGLEIAKGLFQGNLSNNNSNNVCPMVLDLNVNRSCAENASVGSASLIMCTLQMVENK